MQRLLLLCVLAITLVSCGSNDLPVSDEPSGLEENPTSTASADPAATAAPTVAATEPSDDSDNNTDDTNTGDDTGNAEADGDADDEVLFPDVIAVAVAQTNDGTYRFDVTLSSPYDSPERYADAWRVLGPDGTEFGMRFLTHDHAGEQPFTRSLAGVEIPADVTTVTIEGRDQVSGWGGATVSVDL